VSVDDGHLRRVVEAAGGESVLETLAGELGGADLTSFLMEVMRRRSGRVSPADLMRQYERDRFVRPGTVSLRALRAVEDAALGALPDDVDAVVLAPVAPLATHSAVATVDQHKVVSTVRRTEVAADPTNVLALEAAVRRRRLLADNPRSAERVELAGVQRVLRAQVFAGAESFAHFSILGLVTAGRDTGNRGFEREVLENHARFVTAALLAAGADEVRLELTAFSGGGLETAVGDVLESLAAVERLEAVAAPSRTAGAGYYSGAALRSEAVWRGELVECADGGLVDWTQRLVENRKERLMVLGIGLDRLALRTPG
jgi:hypothetical protein